MEGKFFYWNDSQEQWESDDGSDVVRPTTESPPVKVDFMVIRKTLEREIASKQNSVDRLHRTGTLDAAAREDAVREGLAWALFVLTQEGSV